mgnify:FL=1
MASCGAGGYCEDRFRTSVDKNFFCPICTDVLKDPVQCHNEHYFCRACITKHLINSQTCPVCVEKVTEESLSKAPRIVSDYLDGLMVNCDHSEQGCSEMVELGHLETHISVCKYRPVTCPNERCQTTVSMAHLEQHTSENCEYRQVYCEECEDTMLLKKYGKHGCFISKDVDAMKVVLGQVQNQVKEISDRQAEIFEAIRNLTTTVREMNTAKRTTALVASCITPQEILHKGNIVVLGGQNGVVLKRSWLDSVEMYSLTDKTWSKLAPMQRKRASPTAHLYNGRVMVTGGHRERYIATSSVEYIKIHDESGQTEYLSHKELTNTVDDEFSSLVQKLPIECFAHQTALLNDHLWIVGGHIVNKLQRSNAIHMMPIHPDGVTLMKREMERPLLYHGMEMVDNQLLIIGGSTTGKTHDAVKAVLSYNTETNVLKELHPLPFPILGMATVKHGDDVIIIGGENRERGYLNTVFKYSYKRQECSQLQGMIHKRAECAAVISGNKVIVIGGYNGEQGYLSSVECFDLKQQIWHELPCMNEAKCRIAAVFVP